VLPYGDVGHLVLAETSGTHEALLADVAFEAALVPVAAMVLLTGTGVGEPTWTVVAHVGLLASVDTAMTR